MIFSLRGSSSGGGATRIGRIPPYPKGGSADFSRAAIFRMVAQSDRPRGGRGEQTLGEAGGAGTVGEVAVEAWDAFVDGFLERYFAAHPTFAAAAGRHDFDGLLPDWSPEGLAAEAGRLREERRDAAAFQPPARDALLAHTGGELFWWSAAEAPLRNPLFYSAPLAPALYLTREYAPLQERLRAYVAYARAVPRAAAEIRANLRTPLPRTFVELGRLT